MRKFDSGATRDIVEDKFDFEGFLSPLVLNRYAEYMNKHRKQSDGNLRDSDNWQKGIPMKVYMKSGFRHFFMQLYAFLYMFLRQPRFAKIFKFPISFHLIPPLTSADQ